MFTADMFSDPQGTLIEPNVLPGCQGLIAGLRNLMMGPPNESIEVLYNIKGALSIAIDARIFIYCGCGGFDDLGRPKHRSEGTLVLKGGADL